MKERLASMLFKCGLSIVFITHLTYAILTFDAYTPWNYFIEGKIDVLYYVSWVLIVVGLLMMVKELFSSNQKS